MDFGNFISATLSNPNAPRRALNNEQVGLGDQIIAGLLAASEQ
jgi:hypothetical protein